MILLVTLIIPLLVAAAFFLFTGKKITGKEFVLQVGAQLLLTGIVALFIHWHNTSDIEIWNGVVAKKEPVRVSCEHDYDCFCVDVSCGENCSTRVCQTCYDHSYDVDWRVWTNYGEYFNISREDRQGLREPKRWTQIAIGEPTAREHLFTNYIKAAPDSLFRRKGLLEKYQGKLPKYPSTYDYYRVSRVINYIPGLDTAWYNRGLNQIAGEVGWTKQANIVMVTVLDQPLEYAFALEQAWLGGKKNDIVVVISADKDFNIQWAHVFAWTDNAMLKVTIKDEIEELGSLNNGPEILSSIRNNTVLYFKRKPMSDYEYLTSSITPSTMELVVAMVLGLMVSIGLSFLFYSQDTFDDEAYGRYY